MLLRAVRDDWNFKGFGLSLYKSVIFPQSKGVSFRLPLTYNFGVWERHPALPSFSLTVSFFHPPLNVAFNGNASIRMKWLQWALSSWNQWLPALVATLFLTVWRGILLSISALLYPLRRRPLPIASSNAFSALSKLPPPQYSQSVEEWIGFTWSWCPMRSLTRIEMVGWHFYAVQLAALYDRWDWIPRHSAALGWSIVGPVVGASDLWCTASLCLSLSGFYLRDQHTSPNSGKQMKLATDQTKVKAMPTSSKKKIGLSKTAVSS